MENKCRPNECRPTEILAMRLIAAGGGYSDFLTFHSKVTVPQRISFSFEGLPVRARAFRWRKRYKIYLLNWDVRL